jgi:excisionase family DNA binding protein
LDPATPTVPRLLTPQQAADALGISKATLERLAADGEVRRLKVRGSVRYSAGDLNAYVARLTDRAA